MTITILPCRYWIRRRCRILRFGIPSRCPRRLYDRTYTCSPATTRWGGVRINNRKEIRQTEIDDGIQL